MKITSVALIVLTGFAPASAGYLNQMGGGSAMKSSGYGPKATWKTSSPPPPPPAPPAPEAEAPPAASSAPPAASSAPAGTTAPDSRSYLASMGGTGTMKPSSYGPGKGGKPQAPAGGTGMGGYLNSMSGGSQPVAVAEAAAAASGSDDNAVLAAIENMKNNMNKNQQATISVLKDISAGVKNLVSKAEGR